MKKYFKSLVALKNLLKIKKNIYLNYNKRFKKKIKLLNN